VVYNVQNVRVIEHQM